MVNKVFKHQTLGITRRNKLFQKHWESHLTNTKEVCEKLLSSKLESGKSLTILGAGQLLDFPESLYSKYSNQITLVDRSPHAFRKCSKNAIIYDITGTLETWYEILFKLKPLAPQDFLRELENLPKTSPCLAQPLFKDEIILSLNLLSQIPIYWQDSVFSIFRIKFSDKLAKSMEDELINALSPSFKALILSHLRSLVPKGRHRESILITDTHYLSCFLKNTTPNQDPHITLDQNSFSYQDLDIEIADDSNISKVEAMDSLFGISIEKELGDHCKLDFINKWLWHIAPKTPENKLKSTLHRVFALSLTKRYQTNR